MKRFATLAALVALLLVPGHARALGIGVGGFGGVSIPVLQDDNEQGTSFGVRVPVKLAPILTVEPFWMTGSGGEVDQDFGGTTFTREGIDVNGFGANVLLTFGTGFRMFPYAGIGTYNTERTGLDASNMGFQFGVGFGIGLPMTGLSLDVRGELQAINEDDEETTRKWGNVLVGATYNFGLPGLP